MPRAPHTPDRESFSPRPILLAVAVATAGVLPAFLTGGLAVQVRGDIGFGPAALGLAVAAFFASSSMASVAAGRVVERLGSHRGMRISAAASAFSLLGIAAFAHSLPVLVGWLVLGGFANAVAHPATHLSLAREVPPGRQGFSFGIKQSAIPTATLLAGLAVPSLAVTLGWRWAFAAGAALALVVSVSVPPEKGGRPTGAGREARAGDVRPFPLALLALGIGLGSTAATPLGAFIVESAVASGIEVGRAGLLLAVSSATGILVRVVFGYLADGMSGGRLRLVAGMLGVGAGGFVMISLGVGGTSALLVAGAVLAYAAGWGWPGIFNFAVVKTNPGAPAAATGVTQTGASGGAAAGPLLFGVIAQVTSFATAWVACCAIALLAAATILFGRYLLLRDRALDRVR